MAEKQALVTKFKVAISMAESNNLMKKKMLIPLKCVTGSSIIIKLSINTSKINLMFIGGPRQTTDQR